METDHPDKSNDEPNTQRPKMESSEGSTSSKLECKDPFHSLPSDIVAKIIAYIPVAQWSSLESLDKNFRASTWIAWRQMRNINLGRELLIKSVNVESILQKLVERSPFLTSLSGIDLELGLGQNSNNIHLLAEFEQLQSISFGDTKFFPTERGIQLENVVAFLALTRSRTSLKELKSYDVVQREYRLDTIFDRFAASLINGREIRSPLKLETFSFASSDRSLRHIRMDTMDTTRLADIRLGEASIEPDQLTNLIERTSTLRRIELSFLHCPERNCNGPRLRANKELLTALGSLENLMAIKFDCYNNGECACMNIGFEYIEMLKTVGRRGKLRKLAMEERLFDNSSTIYLNQVCATISTYLPNLKSIKLHTDEISDGNVFNIVGMAELEEVNLQINWLSSKTIKKIAQLPRLRRFAVSDLHAERQSPISFKYLADVTTLKDLRIAFVHNGSRFASEVWKKWADGFGSNLERLEVIGIKCVDGLIRFLKKTVRLRVLLLRGRITDQSLMAIARSCSTLEIFGVDSSSPCDIIVRRRALQDVVDRCPKLNRLGGFDEAVINSLQLEKYRKIAGYVDMNRYDFEFDDV